MMGVPTEEATKVYCDNESVVNATTRPEINYHQCREAIAAGHIRVAWINGTDNLADALTKVTVGERRRTLSVARALFAIANGDEPEDEPDL
jgi:hypothetical protein